MLNELGQILTILWIICCCQAQGLQENRSVIELNSGDGRRPVWNVAHMVNALYQIDYYVNEGANSVEFDVSFDWEGTAKYTFHGLPCDCFRSCTKYESIIPYIEYLRQLTTPGHPSFRKELILLFADMKLSGLSPQARYRAGVDIADKFIKYYWQGGEYTGKAYIMLSIPSVEYANFLSGFNHELGKQGYNKYKDLTGVDFSGNEDLRVTERIFQTMNMDNRIWQGDGITNCLPRSTERLRAALAKRDRPGKSYIDKVYWWTLDRMSTMRTVLRLGVDSILTNYPNRFVSVLQEPEFSRRFRMATIDDNPWEKYRPLTAALYDSSYTLARGGNINESEIIPDAEELLYNC